MVFTLVSKWPLNCHTFSFAASWFLSTFFSCYDFPAPRSLASPWLLPRSQFIPKRDSNMHCTLSNLWFIWQCWPPQQMTQIILITQMKRLIALLLISSSRLIIYAIIQSKDWPRRVQGNILWLFIGALAIVKRFWFLVYQLISAMFQCMQCYIKTFDLFKLGWWTWCDVAELHKENWVKSVQ